MSVHQFLDRRPSALHAVEQAMLADPNLTNDLMDNLTALLRRGPKELLVFLLSNAGDREGLLNLSESLAAWTAGPPMARHWRRRH